VSSLTGQIQSLAGFTPSQTIALQDAYWLGYLLGPLLGGYWVLTRRGFKATFITGLGVFTVASLTFWPSSSLVSYPGFVVSNILIGSGLSILEVAANPFIALAGPEDLMESRLNFSQSLWGLASVISPLLSLKVIFVNVTRVGLFKTQWMYLAIALWSSFLGVVVYYVPLSEASDEDLERVARHRERKKVIDLGFCKINLILYISVFGMFFIFLTAGAQMQVSYMWDSWIGIFKPP
jgi:fucose permease